MEFRKLYYIYLWQKINRVSCWKNPYINIKYIVVIVQCQVQYGKYFPSFSYFATLFMSFRGVK